MNQEQRPNLTLEELQKELNYWQAIDARNRAILSTYQLREYEKKLEFQKQMELRQKQQAQPNNLIVSSQSANVFPITSSYE